MEITREILNKMAHLARLEIDESDMVKTLKDMTKVVAWVEHLKEVNTDGIEPLITMSPEIDVMRDDEVGPHLPLTIALANAPKKNGDYFIVPNIMEP